MDVNQAKQEHLLALKGILSSVQETDCDFRIFLLTSAVMDANIQAWQLQVTICRFSYKTVTEMQRYTFAGVKGLSV